MAKILGLDLGTTSIGWAYVTEDENLENSVINKLGVRIIQYDTFSKVDKTGKVTESKDPVGDFNAGRGLSPNADRTAKRGARRNLDRFQLRRENLLHVLKENKIIGDAFIYAEDFKDSTFSTYALRASAANKEVSLEDFAKVLLMINKKRGYKSSRKAKSGDEGMVIDGMAIAKEMYENNLTPGQFVLNLLKKKVKFTPDFYQSDLQNEFERVWNFQIQYHPEILTEEFKKQLIGKGIKATNAIFLAKYKIYPADNKGADKKLQSYQWRSDALTQKVEQDVLAYLFADINNNLNNSSGYLGAISDRSKELYFQKKTVGQYLYEQLQKNAHARLKSQVFYRQDYFDEFETIWSKQAEFHPQLTDELKTEIRDVVIFYQRKLKSQKHLISVCEFEKHHKVIPKSSPLFQEFKIWQILNNVVFTHVKTKEQVVLDQNAKNILFEELNVKGKLNKKDILEILGHKEKDYNLNYREIEGNNTNKGLFEAYKTILEKEGYDLDLTAPAHSIIEKTKILFKEAGIDPEILSFDAEVEANDFDKQKSYQFWHTLHSLEEDSLIIKTLENKFGFKEEYAKLIANVALQPDYGSLSARAIRKILPFLKEGNLYDTACVYAKYKNEGSLTKAELEARILKDEIEILPKNSLRNPVVEKILNQMINVVNAVIKDPSLGKPDEVRIELARELKKSSDERAKMTESISKATLEHEKYRNEIQQAPFSVKNPTRNDIIRYKLYKELETNGFKTLYSNTYIPAELLFSKNFDIEHIIPKAKLFDDSFSNKTLEKRDVNLKKADTTALDFVKTNYASELDAYILRVEKLYKQKEKGISKAKYTKLMMAGNEIPEGFIDRDLRDTQYIAKKSKQILEQVFRTVSTTTGSVTERLRDDWGLINIMQELNFEKYKALGLTEKVEKKDGTFKERITDWSKRNDHRHHAMDALTVAFTKPAYIQYLNNLNAKKDDTKTGKVILGIESKYLERINTDEGTKKVFKLPIPYFRTQAKEHLESVLISFKAKNKVVTKNKNRIKLKGKDNYLEKKQLTPRGQLHKETVYGKIKTVKVTAEKIDGKMTLEKASAVCNPLFREILLKRLLENGNDPKKAFVDLDKNPIWQNEAKGIAIKRVKISGVKNAVALHNQKDHKGNEMLDADGKSKAVDFVSEGNNHHVAIYRDSDGNLQEEVVSLFEAVTRANQGIPIINKNHSQGWEFLFTMKRNEYFVFPDSDFDPTEIDLMDPKNAKAISKRLFRIQKLAKKDYFFRHHLDTTTNEIVELKFLDYKRLSLKGLDKIVKVRINHLGNIVHVGE